MPIDLLAEKPIDLLAGRESSADILAEKPIDLLASPGGDYAPPMRGAPADLGDDISYEGRVSLGMEQVPPKNAGQPVEQGQGGYAQQAVGDVARIGMKVAGGVADFGGSATSGLAAIGTTGQSLLSGKSLDQSLQAGADTAQHYNLFTGVKGAAAGAGALLGGANIDQALAEAEEQMSKVHPAQVATTPEGQLVEDTIDATLEAVFSKPAEYWANKIPVNYPNLRAAVATGLTIAPLGLGGLSKGLKQIKLRRKILKDGEAKLAKLEKLLERVKKLQKDISDKELAEAQATDTILDSDGVYKTKQDMKPVPEEGDFMDVGREQIDTANPANAGQPVELLADNPPVIPPEPTVTTPPGRIVEAAPKPEGGTPPEKIVEAAPQPERVTPPADVSKTETTAPEEATMAPSQEPSRTTPVETQQEPVPPTMPVPAPIDKIPELVKEGGRKESFAERAVAPVGDGTKMPVQVDSADINVAPSKLQFKLDVDPMTGEREKIAGKWDPIKGGIVTLFRDEGEKLWVVNGHHRVALAKRMGNEIMNAFILESKDRYTFSTAKKVGAELNIAEGQGDVYDHATFFRQEPGISKEEAGGRKLQKSAFAIGRHLEDSTYTSFINRRITPEQAEGIAKGVPDDASLQDIALHYIVKNPRATGLEVENFARLVKESKVPKPSGGGQTDLFQTGEGKAWMDKMEAMTAVASKHMKAINDSLTAMGSGRNKKRAGLAGKGGIKVDLDKASAEITRLQEEKVRWSRWQTDHDLFAQVEKSAGYDPEPSIKSAEPGYVDPNAKEGQTTMLKGGREMPKTGITTKKKQAESPGSLFEQPDVKQQNIQESRKGGGSKVTPLSISETTYVEKPARGMSAKGVERVLERFLVELKGANDIDFRVVQLTKDLPYKASDNVEGATVEGRVYLVAENLRSVNRTREVLLHETVGHLGFEKAMGKAFDPILKDVAKNAPAEMNRTADDYGLNLDNAQDRRVVAQEVIARLAETDPKSSLFRRVAARIKRWLKSIGINVRISTKDVQAILHSVSKRLAKTEPLTKGEYKSPAFPDIEIAPYLRMRGKGVMESKGKKALGEKPIGGDESKAKKAHKGKVSITPEGTYIGKINDWFGVTDLQKHRNSVEVAEFQRRITKYIGKRPSMVTHLVKRSSFDLKAKRTDELIQLYVDLKPTKSDPTRPQRLLNKYRDSLSAEQVAKVEDAIEIKDNPTLKKIADDIIDSDQEMGLRALSADVISNVIENHLSRHWRPLKKQQRSESFRKFGTTTGLAKGRTFESILEGWALGRELAIKGATNSLLVTKDILAMTIENKSLIAQLRGTKDSQGNPLLSTRELEGYSRIDHPNFSAWEYSGTIEVKPLIKSMRQLSEVSRVISSSSKGGVDSAPLAKLKTEVEESLVGRGFSEGEARNIVAKIERGSSAGGETVIREVLEKVQTIEIKQEVTGVNITPFLAKDMVITEDGLILRRKPLYAPEKIAKDLNLIFNGSKLRGLVAFDVATKYNAVLKAWVLQTSLYHPQAFGRSYLLGTTGKTLKEWNVVSAYKEGLQSIREGNPTLDLMIKNGMTLGRMQEWDEMLNRQSDTIFGRAMDRMGSIPKEAKDRLNALREAQVDWVFKTLGAGLKAKAALIEFRNLSAKYPEETPDAIAREVAELINADFGGLPLQRLRRNQTYQQLAQLGLLAPDWNESNLRTALPALSEKTSLVSPMTAAVNARMRATFYRKFWISVATKAFVINAVMNALLSLPDDDSFIERYREAWEAGHLRWLDIDITPIAKLFGDTSGRRKYFSTLGHFLDPVKYFLDPVKSVQHKASIISRILLDPLLGRNWQGRPYTSLDEFIETGKLTKWGASHPIDKGQIPSYLLSELRGVQPVQLQMLLSYMLGETDGFTASARGAGFIVHSGPKKGKQRPKRKKKRPTGTLFRGER